MRLVCPACQSGCEKPACAVEEAAALELDEALADDAGAAEPDPGLVAEAIETKSTRFWFEARAS